jgi:membrane-bound serine protease (ClpP class)
MVSVPLIFVIVLVSAFLVIVLALVAAQSRHQKAATGELDLVGAIGCVETTLRPEGSVLVRGELWRARSRAGVTVRSGCDVRIVGASRHLLEVEPTS